MLINGFRVAPYCPLQNCHNNLNDRRSSGMKRFASALAALLLGTAPALSGSYTPVPVDPVVPTPMPVPAFNWTGGYAGFHFGTLSARHRLTFPTNTVLGTQPNA